MIDKIIDEINHFKPDVIGLSVRNFNLKASHETVNIVKENFPELTIVVRGPASSGYQDKIFNTMNADYAFAGEGERPFRQLLELFASDDLTSESKKEINELIYKDKNGQIVCNPPHWENLNELKFCDYELINLNQYLVNGYNYGMHSEAKCV